MLLAIARNLALERGVSSGVAHIRLQEVLRLAGLTTGAAYRIWADQEDFQRDLAATLIEWRVDEPTASTRAVVFDDGWPSTLEEMIRLGAQAHMDSFIGQHRAGTPSRVFLFALALRASTYGSDDLAAASRARHYRSVEEFSILYTEVMQHYRYRLREDYTMTQFATAVAALGEGFALQALEGLDHDAVTRIGPGERAQAWPLFGVAIVALVQEFFVRDDSDPGDNDESTGVAEGV